MFSTFKRAFKLSFSLLTRAWYGMEWKRNFGVEYGRCQNGMECKISRLEWKTIFHTLHTNSILDFAHGISETYIRIVITKNM